jgi:hypothetical protein
MSGQSNCCWPTSPLTQSERAFCDATYKRLESGTFRFPTAARGQASLTISAADWAMLLDGVDLSSVRRGKRYRRQAQAELATAGG